MAAPQQTPNPDEIVSEIRIAAPLERVFQALIDPSQVVQWWAKQASIDAQNLRATHVSAESGAAWG